MGIYVYKLSIVMSLVNFSSVYLCPIGSFSLWRIFQYIFFSYIDKMANTDILYWKDSYLKLCWESSFSVRHFSNR